MACLAGASPVLNAVKAATAPMVGIRLIEDSMLHVTQNGLHSSADVNTVTWYHARCNNSGLRCCCVLAVCTGSARTQGEPFQQEQCFSGDSMVHMRNGLSNKDSKLVAMRSLQTSGQFVQCMPSDAPQDTQAPLTWCEVVAKASAHCEWS